MQRLTTAALVKAQFVDLSQPETENPTTKRDAGSLGELCNSIASLYCGP